MSALWTFPCMLASAFLVTWGAEAAQLLRSQGLALAILAWLQTLPEFAVEAVIAWEAGRDPARAHLAIANLTGAIRLLFGLAWPMIYVVFAVAGWRGGGRRFPTIPLGREHAVEIVALTPPLLYVGLILWRGRFGWGDALVLLACYVAYLWALLRGPSTTSGDLADAPAVSRWAYTRRGWRRPAAITALFGVGGALLVVTVHPFLDAMLALAGALGVSQFVFVQWMAPFLSEFPEKVSAFYWARRVTHAPMALMNIVSSNVNQWTVLAAMIPLVFGYSSFRHHGAWSAFQFDQAQRLEILLTLLQSGVALLVAAKLEFSWRDAAALFALWLAQFLRPGLRDVVSVVYAGWMAMLALQFATGRRPFRVARYFWQSVASPGRKSDRPEPL